MSMENIIKRLAEACDAPEPTPEERAERERREAEAAETRRLEREARERRAQERGWSLASATHPRDRGQSHGKDHIVLEAPLKVGRLEREAGDALCKPGDRFWGLYGIEREEIKPSWTCKRCLDMFGRYEEHLGEEN